MVERLVGWPLPGWQCSTRQAAALAFAAAAMLGAAQGADAQDEVLLHPARPGGQPTRLMGEIVDYTGSQLVLRKSNGRVESVESGRVAVVRTQWSERAQMGLRLLQARKYAEAMPDLLEGARGESRRWAQRRLLADYARCQRHVPNQNLSDAAKTFALVYRDDPDTPYLDCLPVMWSPQELPAGALAEARQWLEPKQNAALQIAAASWLLSGRDRPAAVQTLERLAAGSDHLAALARLQLWRVQLVTVDQSRLDQWLEQLPRLPTSIRGGAHFLIGLAWARLGQPEEAAWHLLRAALLYPGDDERTARSLLEAGRELEKMERPDEALNLFREVSRDYAATTAAPEAQLHVQRRESKD